MPIGLLHFLRLILIMALAANVSSANAASSKVTASIAFATPPGQVLTPMPDVSAHNISNLNYNPEWPVFMMANNGHSAVIRVVNFRTRQLYSHALILMWQAGKANSARNTNISISRSGYSDANHELQIIYQ
jgi:hypothetical protein